MITVKRFKRRIDNAIFTKQGETPLYEHEGFEVHFYAALSNINMDIFTIQNQLGTFQIGDMIQGYGIHTIHNILFNNNGAIVAQLSDQRIVNAVDLRMYVPETPRATPTPAITGNTLRELEVAYIRTITRAIRLEDNEEFTTGARIARVRREPITEFLVKFFKNWNATRNTIYVDDSTVQTEMDKRRSLGDIFAICRYYYPTCTLKEVAKALYVTLPETITDGFRSSYCSVISKRVFYYDNEDINGVFDKTTNDETGHPHRWWIGQLN